MDGFERFFADHYPRVLESLVLATGDRAGAEDAAQEAFSRALVRWSRVRRLDRPATWVYVVAIRQLRRRRWREATAPARTDPGSVPDSAPEVVTSAWIEAALSRMPPRQRLAVVLRFRADLTVAQVAAAMRCSQGTVKSTLHAALARLRADMTEPLNEGMRDGS